MRIPIKDMDYKEVVDKMKEIEGSAGVGLWKDGESLYARAKKTAEPEAWKVLRGREVPGKITLSHSGYRRRLRHKTSEAC